MRKPLPLHILIALADGDRHGYAVMQAIREQSGGEVPVQTASFYRHLAILIDEGLVAESAGRRDGDDPGEGRTTGSRREAGRSSLPRNSGCWLSSLR